MSRQNITDAVLDLSIYRPIDGWYLHNSSGIHGVGHATRVLIWADRIAWWMLSQDIEVDLEAVRWAASLHDVRRVDDGMDPLHGKRSASWILAGNPVPLLDVGEPRRNRIAYCCEWHVPDDANAPQMTPELICLKDADGLDRVRLEDLDPRYLRTEYARGLCQQAQELHDLSTSLAWLSPWEAVQAAALKAGLQRTWVL